MKYNLTILKTSNHIDLEFFVVLIGQICGKSGKELFKICGESDIFFSGCSKK